MPGLKPKTENQGLVIRDVLQRYVYVSYMTTVLDSVPRLKNQIMIHNNTGAFTGYWKRGGGGGPGNC